MPVERRAASVIDTSAYSRALLPAPRCANLLVLPAAGEGSAARSSTSEFQAPHSAQRPIHLGDWAPHSWQAKTTRGDFMARSKSRNTNPESQIPNPKVLAFGIWSLGFGGFPLAVLSVDSRADPADDFVGYRPDGRRHLANIDLLPRFAALAADQHHFIARLDAVDAGDVDGDHVHRHRADDRRAASTNQYLPALLEPQIEAVGITGRHHREDRKSVV